MHKRVSTARSPRSTLSPRLQPPKSAQVQSKKDKISEAVVSMGNQGLSSINNLGKTMSPAKKPSLTSTSSVSVQYVDLNGNRLTIDALSAINPNVACLNLANNPLMSCKIPVLQRLRTLNLDNCGISSFKDFPDLPNLVFLSMANNNLTSYDGLRVIPSLEEINLSGNSFEFTKALTIQAFGSIKITSFNRVGVSKADLVEAFSLSPLVGYSLRLGRDPAPAEDGNEIAKTQAFLNPEKKSLVVSTELDDDKTVTLPVSNCTNIKWTMDSKGSEWIPIPGSEKKTSIEITTAMRLHIIRCDFTMNGKQFSMFTDEPIGRKKGELSLPYPLSPIILGKPIEGSTVSMTPLWVPCRVAWIRDMDTIAQDVDSIVLSGADVNHSIGILMQPHCPQFEDVVFSTVFQATEPVAPLLPLVTGVEFPETVIEGEMIEFTRMLTPDREGASQVLVERATSPAGEWLLVEQLDVHNLQYTPSNSDVGKYLRISYTPLTEDEIIGPTMFFYASAKVMPAFPAFKNAMIAGVPKTSYPLVAIADYYGGVKGDCSYEWYLSKNPIDTRKGPTQRMKLVAKDTEYFTPSERMVDGYIGCLMIPVREDQVVGDSVFVATDSPLIMDDIPAKLDGFDVPEEIIVGKTIRFPSQVDIFLSNTSGFCGFDLLKTGTTYTPREKHIGRKVRIVTDNTDMILGEVQPATPVILEVALDASKWIVGQTASVAISHKHLQPDKLEIIWLKCKGDFEQVVAVDTPEYTFTTKDVNFSIMVVVVARDYSGTRLEPVYSSKSPVIRNGGVATPQIEGNLVEGEEIYIACDQTVDSVVWMRSEGHGFVEIGREDSYILTGKEVGKFIRAQIKLVNSSMVITSTTKSTVNPCAPGADVTFEKMTVTEGEVIKPVIKYRGGVEGKSFMKWYRETEDGWEQVSDQLEYKATAMDVDRVLRFIYRPVRAGGGIMKDHYEFDLGPVEPLPPKVTKVTVSQGEFGCLIVNGKYSGGIEGASNFIWRVYEDGKEDPVTVGKTLDREILPPDNLVGKLVDVVYVPVRSDGYGGNAVASTNKVMVKPLPTVTSAEILVKGGQLVVGCLMRCKAVVSSGATPTFQWYSGDGTVWEPIEGATDVEFTPGKEQEHYFIRCTVTAVTNAGWRSHPFSTSTAVHVEKQKEDLAIVDRSGNQCSTSVHTGELLSTNLSRAKLAAADVKWQREVDGNWVDIVKADEYRTSVNDVGCRLRVVARGKNSAPVGPVKYDKNVSSCSRAASKSLTFKFSAKPKVGATVWTVTCDKAGISMKSKSGIEKTAKWATVKCSAVDITHNMMVLSLDVSTKFVLIPSITNDARLINVIGDENVRDYVIAVIRTMIDTNK